MSNDSTPPITDESTSKQADALLGRSSLVVSVTTSISTLLICLSSDALSTTTLLAVASGVCVVCLSVAFLFGRPKWRTPAARSFLGAALPSFVALAFAWSFAYRDEIRFSWRLTSFSGAPAVLVADNVSRTLLASKAGSTSPRRLASFVNALVQEPHRTRICKPAVCDQAPAELAVTGEVVADARVLLDLKFPSPTVARSAVEIPTTPADALAAVASTGTVLANAFDSGPIVIHLKTIPGGLEEMVKTAYHLGTAVRFARIKGSDAGPHLQAFLELVQALPPEDASSEWIIDGILFATSYYLEAGDTQHALLTFRSRQDRSRGDPRLHIAEAYARLKAGDLDASRGALPAESILEPAVFSIFRGVLALHAGDFWEAGDFFEKAIATDPSAEPRRLFVLHAAIASLASLTNGSVRERGRRIVDHAEHALKIDGHARLMRVFQGFGYALQQDGPEASRIFQELRQGENQSELVLCDYWRARADAETGHRDRALDTLRPLASRQNPDDQVLGLWSELVLERAATNANRSDTDDAIEAANRALAINPNEVKSNRVLGFQMTGQAAPLLRPQRTSLEQSALSHFEKVIRGGGADPDIYSTMSDIYRDLAKAVPAKETGRKSLAVACSARGDGLACRVLRVRDLLDQHDTARASEVTDQTLQWLMDNQTAGTEEHRAGMVVNLAINWYTSKDLGRAEQLYVDLLENLQRRQPMTATRSRIVAQVVCNLGFIYVDQDRNAEALQAFRRSLTMVNQPDCEAGLAVALARTGNEPAAVAAYRRARARDDNYGPDGFNVLRDVNFWSETALKTLDYLARQAQLTSHI